MVNPGPPPASGAAPQPANGGDRALVDAFVAASRALVAVAARSVGTIDEDITLPQYRVLVVLYTQGPQSAGDLAAALEVNPSTASRMIERLVRKRLVQRTRARRDRRILRVTLTADGQRVVTAVMERRRGEIERILAAMPVDGREPLTGAL